jgi:hypothetical protein
MSTGVELVEKSKLPIRLTSRQATGEVLLRISQMSSLIPDYTNTPLSSPMGISEGAWRRTPLKTGFSLNFIVSRAEKKSLAGETPQHAPPAVS